MCGRNKKLNRTPQKILLKIALRSAPLIRARENTGGGGGRKKGAAKFFRIISETLDR